MIPVGPELDVEVARAMGWRKPSDRTDTTAPYGRCNVCGWPISAPADGGGCFPDSCCMRPAPTTRADTVPPYSTALGPQTQAMLDWLRGNGRRIDIQDMANRNPNWSACLMVSGMQQTRAYGSTITEAIARLVVAVAEQDGAR